MTDPTTTQLEAAAVLLGADLASHVANALTGYRSALEYQRLPVAPVVVRFTRLAKVAARRGHLAQLRAGTPDDGPVTYGLRYRQAAAVAGVSERTIRRMVAAGDLPAYRIGNRAVIPAPDLFAYLEESA